MLHALLHSLTYLASTKIINVQGGPASYSFEALYQRVTLFVVSKRGKIIIRIYCRCIYKLCMSVIFSRTNRMQAVVKWSVLNWDTYTWLLLPARIV